MNITRDSSLEELRQAKKEWLASGLETLAACRLIAQELGTRFEKELRYPWNELPAYRWERDGVRIELFTGQGEVYLNGNLGFEERDTLNVWVGDHQVAHYIFTNNPQPDMSDCFFVPGRWTWVVADYAGDAGESQASKIQQHYEAERVKLLQELLIGVEV